MPFGAFYKAFLATFASNVLRTEVSGAGALPKDGGAALDGARSQQLSIDFDF